VLCEVEERHALRYGRSTAAVDKLFEEQNYTRIVRTDGASVAVRNQIYVPDERASAVRETLTALSA
jgi:hypothetical protein